MKMRLRIKDLREDNDLTQKQICAYLICDQSLYSKYERGEREIPLNLIIKLADYYKVSLDYIVGRSDKKTLNKGQNERKLRLSFLFISYLLSFYSILSGTPHCI